MFHPNRDAFDAIGAGWRRNEVRRKPDALEKGARIAPKRFLAAVFLVICAVRSTATPVTLSFDTTPLGPNPFAREISAEVRTPSGRDLRLPAFYLGHDRFAVRARAEEAGFYRLGRVIEHGDGGETEIVARAVDAGGIQSREIEKRPPVILERAKPGRFMFRNGPRYIPLGLNLAWAPAGGPTWYAQAFERFEHEHLNWMRIWMSSWGGLNLDWRENDVPSPKPGWLDLEVAARWDQLVNEAERTGVYLQVVLQHHGQYSSAVNPNWDANPWNAKNPGGFLKTPGDFFVSGKARQLTKQKYRYIVARWSYSPAVLAWELFNEVHWVDAYRLEHNENAVAAWHDEMAAYLRSIDAYGHLVTTSTDEVTSPIYRAMDYYQPHLYSTNMLAAVRRFNLAPAEQDRPIFYGEIGNDHMRVTAEQKAAAVEHVPLVWASIMGESSLPAQIWEGDKLFTHDRAGELEVLARFLHLTRLAERDGLEPFTPKIESKDLQPLEITGSETWRKRRPLHVVVAMDGRQPAHYGIIPRYLVAEANHRQDGFPDRVSFAIDLAQPTTAKLQIANAGPKGAEIDVSIDERVVASHAWAPLTNDGQATNPPPGMDRGAMLLLSVPAGKHTVELRNTGGEDWVDFEKLTLDVPVPVLAAAGKRGAKFIAIWIWNQTGVFAVQTPKTASGTLILDDVPAGRWAMTWWDTERGRNVKTGYVEHTGGPLRLPIPPIARHAALVLEHFKTN